MKLNKKAFGLASGILWGLIVLAATFWVMVKGGGETLILLQQFYFGYSVSFGGAILGFIYGFINGFIFGWIFAWLHNLFVKEQVG